MTVINKVNDDSEIYFSDISGLCFVIQCGNTFFIILLILMILLITLINRALFFSYLCYGKVPFYLQIETSLATYETSSKF